MWRIVVSGSLPGGVFFSINDSHDTGVKEVSGTACLITEA